MAKTKREKSKAQRRKPAVRLQVAHTPRIGRYLRSIASETYFLQIILLLLGLWVVFATALYLTERDVPGSAIDSIGAALYWGVAAFSTAGIADTPVTALARLLGGIWIIVGSAIFFGTIVATITSYFMRPLQRPASQIIDTVEYNLEHLEDLSVEELDLLKETVDALIEHMETLKNREKA